MKDQKFSCSNCSAVWQRFDAQATTIVVKDRVTGHNPAAVLYGQNFYYKRLQSGKILQDD